MEIFKIVGIGIVCAVCYILLKESKPEIAMLIVIVGGILILLMVVDSLMDIMAAINGLVAKTGISTEILGSIIKIIGVGYITEFGAGLCDDVGCKSIGDKVLLGGKVLIMALSLPIVISLYNLIAGLLQ